MNSIAYPYDLPPTTPTLAPWKRLGLRIVEAYVAARRARETLYALRGLSDRELNDIGLTRVDLDLRRSWD